MAPLGTALTENQLAMLWKMTDEPILCFDADRAGQKAAYRAADLALPNLKTGKSRASRRCRKARTDDRARGGALEEVIKSACCLADMACSREIEGGSFATGSAAPPEARIGELANGIRDEGGGGATIARTLPIACSAASRPRAGAAVMAAASSGQGRPMRRSGRFGTGATSSGLAGGPTRRASRSSPPARSCAASARCSPAGKP